MKKFFCLAILLLLSITIISAQESIDDDGFINDPTINDSANACYEWGTMSSKCDSEWAWECGWYLIRFEYGMISRSEFPWGCASILPPEEFVTIAPDADDLQPDPDDPQYVFPTTYCVQVDIAFVQFNGGNFLPAGSVALYAIGDNTCQNSVPFATNIPLVYAPESLEAGDALCAANGVGMVQRGPLQDDPVKICTG